MLKRIHLVAPHGAGKTTLLKEIACQMHNMHMILSSRGILIFWYLFVYKRINKNIAYRVTRLILRDSFFYRNISNKIFSIARGTLLREIIKHENNIQARDAVASNYIISCVASDEAMAIIEKIRIIRSLELQILSDYVTEIMQDFGLEGYVIKDESILNLILMLYKRGGVKVSYENFLEKSPSVESLIVLDASDTVRARRLKHRGDFQMLWYDADSFLPVLKITY